jgi:lambda family phage minor tail protein L
MATFNYYFELDDVPANTYGYHPPIADISSNYTIIMKTGDTVNVRTVYAGSNTTDAGEIRYITAPNNDTGLNDPDATGTAGLDTTWTLTATNNTDYYARWFWYTSVKSGLQSPLVPAAQLSTRLLILPDSFGFTGLPGIIGPGGVEDIEITMPEDLEPFLDGTYDTGNYDGPNVGSEQFYWKLTTDANATQNVPIDSFSRRQGLITGPKNGTTITISPSQTCPTGTYYLSLFHFNTTPQFVNGTSSPSTTGGAPTLIQTSSFTVQQDPYIAIKQSQQQSLDDSLVELFEVTLPSGTILYLHNGLDYDTGTVGENIYFPNELGNTLNEYLAFPIEVTGIEHTSQGSNNRPSLRMANIPQLAGGRGTNANGVDDEQTMYNVLQAEGLFTADDLVNSKVVYRSTFLKHTFRNGDSAQLPTEFPKGVYYIEKVQQEDNMFINYELVSPADMEGLVLPARFAVGKYCAWEYQGLLHGRGGCPVPANSFNLWIDENDRLIATDPATSGYGTWATATTYESAQTNGTNTGDTVKRVNPDTGGWQFYECVITNSGRQPEKYPTYWKRLDICGKKLSSCKVRFQTRRSAVHNTLAAGSLIPDDETHRNSAEPLPFGGFPGSQKFR